MAEIQEELLWLCEAAHVPVIWATQVLDTFVKKGVRHRGELTDAAMAERAECVMLNKGPYAATPCGSSTTCSAGWRATSSRRPRGCGRFAPGSGHQAAPLRSGGGAAATCDGRPLVAAT